MAVVLPIVAQGAQFSFATELGGITFNFAFLWNRRDSSWYLAISDATGTPLIQGIRVTLRTSLLGQGLPRAGWPEGAFFAIDTSGKDIDPAQDDLGSRVKIYYLTAADFA